MLHFERECSCIFWDWWLLDSAGIIRMYVYVRDTYVGVWNQPFSFPHPYILCISGTYVYTCTCTCVQTSRMHTYVYRCTCTYVHIYISGSYVYVHLCTYVHVHICTVLHKPGVCPSGLQLKATCSKASHIAHTRLRLATTVILMCVCISIYRVFLLSLFLIHNHLPPPHLPSPTDRKSVV